MANQRNSAMLSFSTCVSVLLSSFKDYVSIESKKSKFGDRLVASKNCSIPKSQTKDRRNRSSRPIFKVDTFVSVDVVGALDPVVTSPDQAVSGKGIDGDPHLPQPLDVTVHTGESEARKQGREIFLYNLPYETSSDWVRNSLGTFGEVTSVKVLKGPSRKGRFFGFAEFTLKDSADQAIEVLNGFTLNGYKLFVATAWPGINKSRLEAARIGAWDHGRTHIREREHRGGLAGNNWNMAAMTDLPSLETRALASAHGGASFCKHKAVVLQTRRDQRTDDDFVWSRSPGSGGGLVVPPSMVIDDLDWLLPAARAEENKMCAAEIGMGETRAMMRVNAIE